MRSVSVRLADLDRVKINLGIAGENEHTHVLFDCKKAFDQYPNATPFLIVTPPRGDIYPAVVTRDGDIVEWVVTDSDLIYHGNGKVQLQFKQGDIIMKSYEAMTSIAKSSEPTGTVPTPIQNWITQANAILASIPDDINAALAAAKASGEFDGADGVGIAAITLKSTVGLVDTYTITLTDGRDYDFTVTNGTPGQNGVGIQSIAKTSTVGLVDTYTVTLTNGQTYPFTVTNGQNGVEIDDTTPANNKVFSSAKVAEELTDVKNAIQGLDDDKYEKPSGGIPATDLTQAVQNSLSAADSAYQKPSGGIPASDIADGVIPVVDSALSDSSENAVQNKVVKGALDGKAPVIINTATGNPAVFSDGADGLPIQSLKVHLLPQQEGTGDPSPQNIRSILPWNGLKVFGGGKNLLNPANRYASGNNVQYYRRGDRFLLKGGQTYIVSANVIPAQISIFKGTNTPVSTTTSATLTYTPTENVEVWFDFYVPNARLLEGGISAVYGMLEVGQTATAYEPYKPITETDISFPSPVYGGTLDVVPGTLLVEWIKIDFDGSEAWTTVSGTSGGQKYYRFSIGDEGYIVSGELYCDTFKTVGITASTSNYGINAINSTSNHKAFIALRPDIEEITDSASLKVWLSEHNITAVYKLSTPQTIQLSGEQITAIVGNNTIWSDADGSMTIEYPADTKTYINNLIATAIASL